MAGFLSHYYEFASVVLFSIGLTTLMLHKNLIKKMIGLNICDTGIFLFLTASGYIRGRIPPIIVDGVTDPSLYINPIPTGLILTGIVVSVSVTAFSLAIIMNLYKRYETLDLDEILILAGREED